jgi:uncharacterized protein
MHGLSLLTIVALQAIVLVGFVAEAAMGFGATIVTVTFAALLVPIEVVLPAFVPINLALSIYLIARARGGVAVRILLIELAPALAVGCGIGLIAFRYGAHEVGKLVFALFVVVLAITELLRAPLPSEAARPPRSLGFATRTFLLFVGGLVHGLFGSGGPMVVYVTQRRITEKHAFRVTLAVVWLALNAALLVSYGTLGLLGRDTIELALALGLALLPALLLGEWLHRRLDVRRFQLAVCLLLLAGGLALAARTSLVLLRHS